jgi:hypothetical protein
LVFQAIIVGYFRNSALPVRRFNSQQMVSRSVTHYGVVGVILYRSLSVLHPSGRRRE